MAAILEKNGTNGKPLINPGLPVKESVSCPGGSCGVTYSLAYNDSEIYMAGGENNTDRLKRTARETVGKGHESHSIGTYVWEGAEKGWVDGRIAE